MPEPHALGHPTRANLAAVPRRHLYNPADLDACPCPADTVPLVPTNDRAPVEHAVVDDIASTAEPETFLWITFHRPDGGATIRYAWTAGGETLGNHIDQLALAAGLDGADWLHITDRNCQHSTRGRITIDAYLLRPVLADVQNRVRCPEPRRDGIRRVIASAIDATGSPAQPVVPRWPGVGPSLLARPTP